jgi:hypothetical protein
MTPPLLREFAAGAREIVAAGTRSKERIKLSEMMDVFALRRADGAALHANGPLRKFH